MCSTKWQNITPGAMDTPESNLDSSSASDPELYFVLHGINTLDACPSV